MANPPATRADIKIAIICALPVEATAVWPLFKDIYSGYQYRNLLKASDDDNAYTLGRIGEYDVVLAHMPDPGKRAASSAAVHLKRTYPGIELAFLIGVCGAVPFAQSIPHPSRGGINIFLGDVIVSHEVVEYDFGTRLPSGFVRKDMLTFSKGRACQDIRSIIAKMKASQVVLKESLSCHLSLIQEKQHVTYPGLDRDILWQSTYEHVPTGCQCSLDFADIDHSVVSRRRTSSMMAPLPRLHFGSVASGDTVVKSATYRDEVAASNNVLAYEMELAGVWDSLPCILIKGVADYADSHKSKEWQEYAAACSAAYMRALLDLTPIAFKPTESGPSNGSAPDSRDALPKRRVEETNLREAADLPCESSKKQQTLDYGPSNNLRSPSKQFTGREELRERLTGFFAASPAPRSRRRDFVLYGAGGFGKTQICLKFAEECAGMFWKIFWIDASSVQTLDLSFREIALDPVAKTDGVEDSVASVTQWLFSRRKEWLLIFDNADEDPASIEGFLVNGRYGNTLITTRNPNMRDLSDPGGFAQVKQMRKNEAIQLFSRLLYMDDLTAEALEKIDIIVQELGCLPLAIQHAASAINSALCTIDDYLQTIRQHFFHLLGDPAMRGASFYDKNQLAAWETSVMAIQSDKNAAKSIESTLGLMQILSFFHPNNIMEEIFRRAARLGLSKSQGGIIKPTTGLSEAKSYLPGELFVANKRGEWDSLVFKTAIQELYRHSFIELHHMNSTYTLHPVIHFWLRHRMTTGQQVATFRAATAILAASIELPAGTADYTFSRQLLPHVHALRTFQLELDLPEEYFEDAQNSFWTLFEINERWQEARDIGLRVVEQQRNHAVQDREKEMRAIARLSWAYRMIGTLSEAERLQKEALSYRKQALGNEHKDTLESMSHLAWIYHDQGRYKDAEDLQTYVYETQKALNYNKHDIFKTATALSETYCGWNKWKAAVELLELAVRDMKTELGLDSTTTVGAMASLAVAYHELYLLKEAEKTKLDVLRIRRKIQGDRHPATLTAIANLTATYVRQERLDEALDLVDNLIRTRTEVLGEEHRDTLTSLLILTNIYIRKKMWIEAEKTCMQVIAGRESALPVNHPHTLWAKANLAMIHHHQGCLDESATEWQDIIAMQQKVRGAEHMETLLSMHNLALVWRSQGKSEEALHLMTKVLNTRRRSLGQSHFRTVESEQVLLRWERSDDAQTRMEEPSQLVRNIGMISVGEAQGHG